MPNETGTTHTCCECNEEVSTVTDTQSGTVCDDCIDDYNRCADCGDMARITTYNCNDDGICEDCGDNYTWCNNCDRRLHVDDCIFGYCEDCGHEEEEDGFEHRKPSGKIVSTESGDIIKSKRLFGIELELVSEDSDYSTLDSFVRSVNRSYGAVSDGSIDGAGLEIVSPILGGKAGEESVFELCKEIERNGMTGYDESCGFHVHLDGDGIADKIEYKLCSIEEAKIDPSYKTIFLIDKSIMLKRHVLDLPIEKLKDVLPSSYTIHRDRGETHTIFDYRGLEDIENYKKITRLMHNTDWTEEEKRRFYERRRDKIVKNYVRNLDKLALCVVKKKDNFIVRKNMLYTYTVLDSVLSLMVGKKRAENTFCKPLSNDYSLEKIERLKDDKHFDVYWYSTKRLSEADRMKGEHYHSSRYHSINFHSLFNKHHTLEIRLHGGESDPLNILYWVAMNQHIVDCVVSGKVTIEKMKEMLSLVSQDKKVDFFLKTFKFRKQLKEYIVRKINHYNK